MSDFLHHLQSRTILCDGAMGSYLYNTTGRLSEINHCYEHFNLLQPEIIKQTHLAYLSAGSHGVKTNTFSANCLSLKEMHLDDLVADINRAGITIARDAIAHHQATHPSPHPYFVIAAIGPSPEHLTTPEEIDHCYRCQIETILSTGVDALLLETFHHMDQLEALIQWLQTFPSLPPIIAEFSPGHQSTNAFNIAPAEFVQRMANLNVAVAGINCCAPWDASAFVDAVKDLPVVISKKILLSAMPNASGFQRYGNRLLTTFSPESAGRLARTLSDLGVKLIGGCCEMHPPHIQEMHNFLHSRQASVVSAKIQIESTLAPTTHEEKVHNGPFSKKLIQGEFAVSLEALPPRGTDPAVIHKKIQQISQIANSGLVDAIDFTDGSRGIPLITPGDFILKIRDALKWSQEDGDPIELIPHFTTRDLNIMGIQSRLVGFHANRIHNVLMVTGDPPKMSPTYPRATAVFDVDSTELIRLTHSCLNAGVDFGGMPLGKHADPRTHFTIGTGVEPEAHDIPRELARLQTKIDHGANYVMTQPAFHQKPLAILEPFRTKIPIVVGVMVLNSFDHAQRMARVPGVVIPDSILNRFAQFSDVQDQIKVGRDFAAEQIQLIRKEGWAGLYLMSTATLDGTLDILKASL